MTPNFREIAEKILNAHIMADINQQPTILVDRISEALRQVYEQRPKVEISDAEFNKIYMDWALDRDTKKLPIGDVYFNFRQGFLAALSYVRHSESTSECQE